jgi:hypothetical protein
MQRFAQLLLLGATATLVHACAGIPEAATVPTPQSPPLPAAAGFVIGSVSYDEVSAGDSVVVHLEPATPDAPPTRLTLPVRLERGGKRGLFAGPLPAGAYAFRDASSGTRRYTANGLRMPFEVRTDEIVDAGHYHLSPSLPVVQASPGR